MRQELGKLNFISNVKQWKYIDNTRKAALETCRNKKQFFKGGQRIIDS
jgi:hypothetical protein